MILGRAHEQVTDDGDQDNQVSKFGASEAGNEGIAKERGNAHGEQDIQLGDIGTGEADVVLRGKDTHGEQGTQVGIGAEGGLARFCVARTRTASRTLSTKLTARHGLLAADRSLGATMVGMHSASPPSNAVGSNTLQQFAFRHLCQRRRSA